MKQSVIASTLCSAILLQACTTGTTAPPPPSSAESAPASSAGFSIAAPDGSTSLSLGLARRDDRLELQWTDRTTGVARTISLARPDPAAIGMRELPNGDYEAVLGGSRFVLSGVAVDAAGFISATLRAPGGTTFKVSLANGETLGDWVLDGSTPGNGQKREIVTGLLLIAAVLIIGSIGVGGQNYIANEHMRAMYEYLVAHCKNRIAVAKAQCLKRVVNDKKGNPLVVPYFFDGIAAVSHVQHSNTVPSFLIFGGLRNQNNFTNVLKCQTGCFPIPVACLRSVKCMTKFFVKMWGLGEDEVKNLVRLAGSGFCQPIQVRKPEAKSMALNFDEGAGLELPDPSAPAPLPPPPALTQTPTPPADASTSDWPTGWGDFSSTLTGDDAVGADPLGPLQAEPFCGAQLPGPASDLTDDEVDALLATSFEDYGTTIQNDTDTSDDVGDIATFLRGLGLDEASAVSLAGALATLLAAPSDAFENGGEPVGSSAVIDDYARLLHADDLAGIP